MRYSFRLAELLGHAPTPRRRPGTIKAICDYTGLDRHQVAALLKNESKSVPIEALSHLCDYLVEHGHAKANELPGALFGIEPENFWELLARRKRLELCLGVRSEEGWPEGAWMRAGDSLLLGELLKGVTTLGGTAKHIDAESDAELYSHEADEEQNAWPAPSPAAGQCPHPEALEQSLIWAPEAGIPEPQVHARANEVYDQFSAAGGDKALVCLGIGKSNPVVEIVLGQAFACGPWDSQDNVASASDRSCPIFFRYREDDPQPTSCCGGMQLSKDQQTEEPGIYYEKKDGTWGKCGVTRGKTDAAVLFYIHRESQGRLEMVLGGFSGLATRLLAKTLATRSHQFWPPVYSSHGLHVGAFVIEYSIKKKTQSGTDILATAPVATHKIIRLDKEVIERRLEA